MQSIALFAISCEDCGFIEWQIDQTKMQTSISIFTYIFWLHWVAVSLWRVTWGNIRKTFISWNCIPSGIIMSQFWLQYPDVDFVQRSLGWISYKQSRRYSAFNPDNEHIIRNGSVHVSSKVVEKSGEYFIFRSSVIAESLYLFCRYFKVFNHFGVQWTHLSRSNVCISNICWMVSKSPTPGVLWYSNWSPFYSSIIPTLGASEHKNLQSFSRIQFFEWELHSCSARSFIPILSRIQHSQDWWISLEVIVQLKNWCCLRG